MTVLTDKRDIDKIRSAGRVIKDVFSWVESNLRGGISTAELDQHIEDIIISQGGVPAFKGYRDYPATICASINEVVVHGIPSQKAVLREGDIIGIDVGVLKNGFFADAARTYIIGEVAPEVKKLVDTSRRCLRESIKQAVAGNRISDISSVIESIARSSGYEEVRMFVGHGIGRALHEAPEVPNWGEKGKGPILKEGLVLAIEPMINMGTRRVKILSDGWTAVTMDGKLSSHFEDTVIVGSGKAEVIT